MITLLRKANEGFVNYTHDQVLHKDEQPVQGCFAFVNEMIEDALSYNPMYAYYNGKKVEDRDKHTLHKVRVSPDLPVVARYLKNPTFIYEKEHNYFSVEVENNLWVETTIGEVVQEFKNYQQALAAFRQEHGLPESRNPLWYYKYYWFEVIVDVEKLPAHKHWFQRVLDFVKPKPVLQGA